MITTKRRRRIYLTIPLTMALLLSLAWPHLAPALEEWRDPQARLERLQEKARLELRRYYQGDGSWFRCHRLLQRLEQLQQDGNEQT